MLTASQPTDLDINMRHVLLFLLVLVGIENAMAVMVVPGMSGFYEGVDEDSMRVKLSQMDLQPIEGIWYYPAEDMTVAIERYEEAGLTVQGQMPPYHIVLLSSPDIDLLPGTEIGYVEGSAKPGEYTLHIFTERDKNDMLHSPVKCYALLNPQASAITFERPKWDVKVRVNFARFLPSLFKGVSIIPHKEEKKVEEGFRKIFPEGGNGNPVNKVIYL